MITDVFKQEIKKILPDLSDQQMNLLIHTKELYEIWNQQINVISRKDMDSFYIHHVLHSLAIVSFLKFQPGSRILDLGTGGGFPGIPLAIVFPEVQFHLVDSIGKKIKVVNEVVAGLGLSNVSTQHARVEEVKGQFDFVVSRAVAPLSELLSWTKGKYSGAMKNALPNGLICLKGGDLKEE
ncbi:MAG: 16S rRNA (guanine(527)-N(7))-methyltransferase RsmG, partial [Bacteroidetes bacterium]|nr:16S rRNA (guanine(527)-N(7))-methyltransferase RsmG [Bacteroidota bacterium]